jgi:hypothetical protein
MAETRERKKKAEKAAHAQRAEVLLNIATAARHGSRQMLFVCSGYSVKANSGVKSDMV